MMLPDAFMTNAAAIRPRIAAHDDLYTLTIRVAGISPSDIAIVVKDGRLTIVGETKAAGRCRSVDHSLALPPDADGASATAEASDGILTIYVPKKAAEAPLHISVDDESTAMEEEGTSAYTLTMVAAGIPAAELTLTVEEGRVLSVRG